MEAAAGSFDYVLRYKWNRDTAKGVGIGLIGCAVGALLPAPIWARIVVIGGCGSLVVLLLIPSILRPTALLMDERGVWIHRSWMRRRGETYPWSAIEALVLFSSRTNQTIAVQCHDGVAPRVRPPRTFMRRLLAAERPGIPPHIAVTGVTITRRLVDTARLLAAVDHFAPSVPVVDVSAGRLRFLRPGQPA